MPLSRSVAPEEYRRIVQTLCRGLKLKEIDESTDQPERIMLLPSCSFDAVGDYVFLDCEGEDLNPDGILKNAAAISSLPSTQPRTWEPSAVKAYRAPGADIPEGTRNNTLHSEAVRLLKRHGDSPATREAVDNLNAEYCKPPLPLSEVDNIWKNARQYYHERIESDPAYVDPAEYNRRMEAVRPENFTDLHAARAFRKAFADVVKYTQERDWAAYDKKRGVWCFDVDAATKYFHLFTDMQERDARELSISTENDIKRLGDEFEECAGNIDRLSREKKKCDTEQA
ncbi:MAG: primase alpha helix C-terminal domain-containing protein, partial [Synergistes sp.]|nr:primase alpha helix C-terminal domain-containing protein [Synergistes sp.]